MGTSNANNLVKAPEMRSTRRVSLWSRCHHLVTGLRQHYNAPLVVMFRQFRAGAIYFTVGLMTVLMANAHLQPSLLQELTVLAGLALGGLGFVMAMTAHMRMIIGRIIGFFRTSKPQGED